MSFEIFASGTNGFHYEKKGCEDGSTFEAIKVITTLQGLDYSSLAKVAKSGAKDWGKGKINPIPSVVDVMIHLANNEMLHNLSNAAFSLAMNPNSSDGSIFINATERHTLWADTIRNAKYNFLPGDSPGAEFVKTISSCLKDTNLNNFGVLQQLSIVLSEFFRHIDDSMTPRILITLTG